jgi:uncharacterized protein with HEPN domain
MPPREVAAYLLDVWVAAERVVRIVGGLSEDQYGADENVRLVVERSLEIIGEALRQAIAREPALEMKITDARRIVQFRNFLAHAYHLVDHSIVWKIAQVNVPVLLAEVAAMMEQDKGERESS